MTRQLASPRARDLRDRVFMYHICASASEVSHYQFCHILCIKSKSLRPTHTQEYGNWAPPVEGRTPNYVCIYFKSTTLLYYWAFIFITRHFFKSRVALRFSHEKWMFRTLGFYSRVYFCGGGAYECGCEDQIRICYRKVWWRREPPLQSTHCGPGTEAHASSLLQRDTMGKI